MIILVLLIATALAFDFTNGFHDTGNAMATSIATGALKPKTAVLLAGVLNLVGAFLSVEVAVTVTTSVLKVQDGKTGHLLPGIDASMGLTIIFAGLIGAITWNMLTWLLGLPSSSSHALFGGLIGATLVGASVAAIDFGMVLSKVVLPALIAPFTAGVIAFLVTRLAYAVTRRYDNKPDGRDGFRWGQIFTSSLVALAHGTNDAQKTMGIITLALVANGNLTAADPQVPTWGIIGSASAIALGTYSGGWRIILTMGSKIIKMDAAQGFVAQGSGAAVILAATHVGFPLSTTHVISGGVVGAGAAKRLSAVRWGVAKSILTAWVLTFPAAALVAAVCYWIAHIFLP